MTAKEEIKSIIELIQSDPDVWAWELKKIMTLLDLVEDKDAASKSPHGEQISILQGLADWITENYDDNLMKQRYFVLREVIEKLRGEIDAPKQPENPRAAFMRCRCGHNYPIKPSERSAYMCPSCGTRCRLEARPGDEAYAYSVRHNAGLEESAWRPLFEKPWWAPEGRWPDDVNTEGGMRKE